MTTRPLHLSLALVLAAGCGGASAGVVGATGMGPDGAAHAATAEQAPRANAGSGAPASARNSSTAATPSGAVQTPSGPPVPLQFEPGRNFNVELDDFQHLVWSEHPDPGAVRRLLKVEPTRQVNYTSVTGTTMCGWEFQFQGPKPDAPFFEAFAASYPKQSFYVFFEKTWFRWRAVDCGFHESDMLGESAVDG